MEQRAKRLDEPLETELVRQFVRNAHTDLDTVREMLDEQPGLLHATVNWGGADWESGLGAAAHVGRRDIAEFLLERGARLDLFAAAMLGQLKLVQLMIGYYPAMAEALGPHGIPLIRHAAAGGAEAQPVLEYLQELARNKSG